MIMTARKARLTATMRALDARNSVPFSLRLSNTLLILLKYYFLYGEMLMEFRGTRLQISLTHGRKEAGGASQGSLSYNMNTPQTYRSVAHFKALGIL